MVQNLGIRPFYEKIENEKANDNSQKGRYKGRYKGPHWW
jgi:hypothetical protein